MGGHGGDPELNGLSLPTHHEQRVLAYEAAMLFDLVADVEKYPEFLPWCTGCRIIERLPDGLVAETSIGFKGISEKFTSQVKLDREALEIHVGYRNGPFRHLSNHWYFASRGAEQTEVDFGIDFEFRSHILERLIGHLFDQAMQRIVTAFENRAATMKIGIQPATRS